jgi:hypothetical protein
MADEITVTTTLAAVKGTAKFSDGQTARVDWTTARETGLTQSVGTTHEAITISADVATPGWAYFKNNDSTNFCDLGLVVAATFYPLIRLKAGEAALFRLSPAAAPYAKADTAAVDLEWSVLND